METKKIGIVIGAVVLVAVVGALYFAAQLKGGKAPYASNGTSKQGDAAAQNGTATRTEVSGNVTVPDQGATNVAANIAVPKVVGPAGPTTTASFRKFQVNVQNDTFMPDTVIAHVGDNVHIDFTAQDKDYDFTQPDYGFKAPLPKGKTTPVEFGVTAAGKYLFYCSVCGGPAKGPKGYIEVVPK